MKAVKKMKKRHSRSGFTMAEMLIVVGIIVVLTGVSFIAVQRYQRSMAQLECEAVAKEIFVAAQNHLTMAESQGYLGVATAPGSEIQQEENETTQGIYYLVNGGSAPAANSLLELMLPFGSIDETVRARGSYLIRYQLKPATVLDVFYCSQTGKYAHKIEAGEYAALLAARDSVSEGGTTQSNKSARLNYDSAVLGWYGGTGNLPFGSYLDAPKIEVENAERLIVKISNVNKDKTITDVDGNPAKSAMKLIVTGEDSHACMSIVLKIVSETNRVFYDNSEAEFIVVLDDITTKTESGLVNDGLHFADLNKYANSSISTGSAIAFMENEEKKTPKFLPGENITVYAVAYSNEALTNIAYSNEETTNSLFADYDAENSTAMIGNFRHLENLDGAVSGVMEKETGSLASVEITAAQQIVDLGELPESEESGSGASGNGTGNGGSGEGSGASGGGAGEEEVDLTGSGAGSTSDDEKDLSWTGFVEEIKKTKADNADVKVYALGDETGTKAGCYRPVRPSYPLTYKGGYTVGTGVTAVKKEHIIVNVTVDGDGAAGLFGAPTAKLDVSDLTLIDFSITGAGDAGALAGTLANDSTVSNVLVFNSDIRLNDAADGDDGNDLTGAAAPTGIASTGGNAGGLIGSMTGGSVTGSAAALIVSSEAATGANAGGLIGSAAKVAVRDSYAGGHTTGGVYVTTSPDAYNVTAASGTAGGLIGKASGGTTVEYCYSTCSASGNVAGGLIGTADASGDVSVSYSYAVGKALGGTAEGSATGTFLGSGSLKDREDVDFIYAVDMDSEDLLMPATVVEDDDKWKVRNGALPYDTQLDKQYIYPTVNQLYHIKAIKNEEGYTALENQPVHLSTHYGDWEEIKLLADADLALINAERLSAKITLPKEQIADGGVITMLIRGETSHPIAVSNDAYDETKDAFLVLKVTKPASVGGEYTLSLSPVSVVPGVTAENLQTWFSKLKKAGVGVKVPASNDATQTNAEIELNLDDITAADKHFAQLFKTFIPGENISVAVKGGVVTTDKLNAMVKAVMTDTEKNSSTETDNSDPEHPVTRTVAARTNSLFADPKTDDYGDGTDVSIASTASASIANFRHLENLDNAISGVNAPGATLRITKAVQIADLSDKAQVGDQPAELLSWTGFGSTIVNGETDSTGNVKKIKIYKYTETTEETADGYFLPVNPAAIEYDGQGHSITGVVVNTAGEAGLFGALISDSTVKNLELIDFDITATSGNAGALAGTLNSGATIENVLARNSASTTTATVTVTAGTGSAGGLIGSMSGADAKVEYCAAALVVNSSGGDAGGLIGKATGGTVSGSYSGGHTLNGAYSTTAFNVTATGSAGGLIGSTGSATVTNCYSTCSAKGATAGGLVGTASGTFANCYATGLVDGSTKGAFAGSFSGLTDSEKPCLYFETVNSGMAAIGDNTTGVTIRELDENLIKYKEFVGTTWTDAKPYDAKLEKDYDKQYNLKSIGRLIAPTKLTAGTFVATHYGDWPMPGILVNNTKNAG